MTDDIINQAIEEATVPAEVIEAPIEERAAESEQEDAPATEELTTDEPKESDDVVFPKKAINALSRRDKQIGKLQAERAALQAELQTYREKAITAQNQDAPNEDSFDNYGDYIKAVARHELKQETSQEAQKDAEARLQETDQRWLDERSNYTIEKTREAISTIPGLQQLITENADVVASLHPNTERAFLEADEPVLAFYALAKEGKLEALQSMSPAKAAMEIGKAEIRGAEYMKNKPVTKAPAPITPLKGNGQVNKNINGQSSWSDIQKWLNS